MHIVFITYNYPSKARPFCGAFVRNFVRAIARMGVKCIVINPVSIFHIKYGVLDPVISWDKFIPDNSIEIMKPRYFSASSKNLLLFNTDYITHYFFYAAVRRMLKDINPKPDILYGHFIYPSGAVAARLGFDLNITSISAVGEDTTEDFVNKHRLLKNKLDIRQISGIVAVSTVNKARCVKELGITEDKIIILPNGIDFSLFYPRDRVEMRKKYNLPLEKTIIAFTGHFDERKGPIRVLEAISELNNIGVVLMGSGSMTLEGSNILFKGVVEHEIIPELLSAADMFVLPTLSEGACNAILEAMACGLPIISSIGEYNDDILNSEVSIRINPMNVAQIRQGIELLHTDDGLRKKYSEAALKHAKKYNVNFRAESFLNWIDHISQLG